LNGSSYKAGNSDHATNPHPHPMDFVNEIRTDADIGWLHHIPFKKLVVSLHHTTVQLYNFIELVRTMLCGWH